MVMITIIIIIHRNVRVCEANHQVISAGDKDAVDEEIRHEEKVAIALAKDFLTL